jgi:hypothetical protein
LLAVSACSAPGGVSGGVNRPQQHPYRNGRVAQTTVPQQCSATSPWPSGDTEAGAAPTGPCVGGGASYVAMVAPSLSRPIVRCAWPGRAIFYRGRNMARSGEVASSPSRLNGACELPLETREGGRAMS